MDEVQIKTAFFFLGSSLTPTNFFVTIVANMELLEKLEQELSQWTEEGGNSDLSFKSGVGEVVTARLQESEGWVRARVLEVLREGRVKVFCVDTGETAVVEGKSLGLCPSHLARRLPFQALPCGLEGWELQGGSSDWDRLFDLTRDKCTDEALVLQCRVVSRGNEGDWVRLSSGAGDLLDRMMEAGL